MILKLTFPLKLLLLLPICTYLISYVYLAIYHKNIILLSTIIHEGGLYNFIETLLYASHFLGHIPVHIVIALYFVGVYYCMSDEVNRISFKNYSIIISIVLVIFLIFTWILSIKWFGFEDTLDFILQKKQSVVTFEEGGSWNLHLPSTIMQIFLIPVYIFTVKYIFRSKIKFNKSGKLLITSSLSLLIIMTFIVNQNVISSLIYVWTEPRYLAHSVRELMTFPIIYYPIPLFFFLHFDTNEKQYQKIIRIPKTVLMSAIIFFALFIYQSVIPLLEGIGSLAQKPDFAKDGTLSIAYLLSSHYFEHFLDTIFFTLLSLILFFSCKTYSSDFQKSNLKQ